MSYMAWNEHFVTGFPVVDDQHLGLVDMINQVAPFLSQSGPAQKEQAATLLDDLFKYAATHFRDEEAMMAGRSIDRDYLRRHHGLHQTFVDELTQLRRLHDEGDGLDGSQLLRFLTSWLTFHILGEDQVMAHQLRLIESGLSPSDARREVHEAAQEDPAKAVLNSALLDLFALNRERNEALTAANGRLKLAQDALASLNAGLERQVAARTEELLGANAALERDRAALQAAIVELRHTQTALNQAEKLRAVGQLAAGLAHEINTPVQFIGDNVAFLKEGIDALTELAHSYKSNLPPTPELRKALDELEERLDTRFLFEHLPVAAERSQQGLMRVSELVGAIMEYSRADLGGKEPADLNRALDNCITVVQGQFGDVAVVDTRFAVIPPVVCRLGELKQAFMNLLTNAADAIRDVVGVRGEKGRIEVGTRLEGDRVVVWVSDTGTGIPDAVAPRIFEPFFTTKEVGKGTGQGLSVCRAVVVDHHGGTLDFETSSAGTTFYIRLPVSAS